MTKTDFIISNIVFSQTQLTSNSLPVILAPLPDPISTQIPNQALPVLDVQVLLEEPLPESTLVNRVFLAIKEI